MSGSSSTREVGGRRLADMRKSHHSHILANLALVRHVLEQAGHTTLPPTFSDGLSLVQRWADGEDVPNEDLLASARAVHETPREPSTGSLSWAGTAIGNLCWMTSKGRNWQDGDRSIGDAAKYTLTSLRSKESTVQERLDLYAMLEAFHADALAAAYEQVESRPKVKRRKSAPPPLRKVPDLTPFIGAVAARHLAKLKAKVDAAQVGDEERLRAACAAHRFEAHPEVVAFEARYGGIVANEEITMGPWTLVNGGFRERGGSSLDAEQLVPVALYRDVAWFLGRGGRGWVQDLITDPQAIPVVNGGDALVAQLLLLDRALTCSFAGGSAELSGTRGEEVATALSLSPLVEADGEGSRFWGEGRTMVHEVRRDDGWVTLVSGPGAATFVGDQDPTS